MSKNYTIGLDIGTTSVGWAVIDDDFNLVHGKKKIVEIDADGKTTTRKSRTNLWGVRLFEEAQAAEDRRLKRSLRRRIARRKKRLQYLREMFESDILAFDDSFFIRMEESFYQNDDHIKTVKTRYPLFNGKSGAGETYDNDMDYYKEYPTIYHLRKRLVENKEQADLRLVYLAMHHILKFRGHFVNQGQKFDLKNLLSAYQKAMPFNFHFDVDDVEKKAKANDILTNRNWSKTKKAFELTELYRITDDEKLSSMSKKELDRLNKQQKALYTAIVGNGIDIAKIFGNDDYKPNDENKILTAGNFKYSNENFEDKLADIEPIMTPEALEVLTIGKKVYESVMLSNILTANTLAASMVEKYDLHKEQLAELKSFSKSISTDLFHKIFKAGGIYANFIQGTGNPAKTTSREDFYKALKKQIESALSGAEYAVRDDFGNSPSNKKATFKFPEARGDNEPDFNAAFETVHLTNDQQAFIKKISKSMKFDTYLPKQRMSDNGAIPYQVHEHELIQILNNQKGYYPFLGEVVNTEREKEDGSFETIIEYKIQTLFKFRIPYYVGTPAKEAGWVRDKEGYLIQTNSKAKNSWLERKSDEKLTPWNFNDVIDKEKSAVNFIERMTNFCTYLPSEKVLPQHSLLYQEYTIYNELIMGGYYQNSHKCYFDASIRQKIVDQLFKENRKVSAKVMIKFLNNELSLNLESPKELFGIDTFVKSPGYNTTYSTYQDLINAGITGEQIESYPQRFEEIIKWQTIFEDKKVLEKTIRNVNEQRWNGFLTSEQVMKLAKKHYRGWGRLSAKMIAGIKATNGKTIIENLREDDAGVKYHRNFMRLLEDPKIAEAIKKAQVEKVDEDKLSYKMVADLAGSPALKKGIWQSLKVIKELEGYLGRENISKIVVEMAREAGGGRTKTRQKKIEDFYNKFKDRTGKDLDRQLRAEFASIKDAKQFDNEKLFLYFMQNAKCMYSEADLNLDRLSEYEVDHIIPQTYIKDDSFDNKVLVKRRENQNKGGDVPSQIIINRMYGFWEILAKSGQVSSKKLANLSKGRLGDEIKKGFINRQLVETRQITKHVATMLSNYFLDTEIEILTPKSSLTSQFRSGVVYVDKSDFDVQQFVENKRYFEMDNKIHLPNGDVIEGRYSNANFVKVHFHEGFVKNRDLNDYHHAHDAYLNAVVAIYVYNTRPDLREAWVHGKYKRKLSQETGKFAEQRQHFFKQLLSGMADENWYGYDVVTGEIILEWNRDAIVEKIKSNLGLRNMNIVKKTELQLGKFSDESVHKKDLKAKNFATGLKVHLDPSRYGGTKTPMSALTVVVRNEAGEIKPLSVSAMMAEKYLKSTDKLAFMQSLHSKPKDKVAEIVIEKVAKFNKYILPNGIPRLVASYQEGKPASQLPMMKIANKKSSNEELNATYVVLADFVRINKLFAEDKLKLLDTEIKESFERSDIEVKIKMIEELIRVTKGSNQKLKTLKEAGLDSTSQQLKSGNTIQTDTILVHQSMTGLYETRRKL